MRQFFLVILFFLPCSGQPSHWHMNDPKPRPAPTQEYNPDDPPAIFVKVHAVGNARGYYWGWCDKFPGEATVDSPDTELPINVEFWAYRMRRDTYRAIVFNRYVYIYTEHARK